MSRRKQQVPGYLHHKGTGQARVVLDGKTHYLGNYGSQESKERYGRLIAQWQAGGLKQPSKSRKHSYAIQELIADYTKFAEGYYRKDGEPTKEILTVRHVLKTLQALYGSVDADEFGPRDLKAVRQDMIERDLSRGQINRLIGIVKRMYRWGVSFDCHTKLGVH